MITGLLIFITLVGVLTIFVVLIQSSKGGGLAGTFGGGDASTVFGVRRTADFLVKLTTVLATIFLLFSLITNVLINKSTGPESIIQKRGQEFPQQTAPNQLQQQQPPPEQQQQNQQPPNQQPPK